ncbi:hypothetical protein HanRHA438_Chr05g0234721 [Helianthus annuus]|uniref:Uncharacterized protein n=1 Tax=Helianthus annuus TaxID=4232 RepID=A0A9K3NN90_HELAN|nr:hypothetical protein HanXRQr2_Chr05g0225801 [Helianthus annuus]KAJ0585362.1 hypothetical protein HanHA89_Chr05g0199501 [Helianthus annuus]KAJ0919881.1 hypothetical protein HanRHA438_Chr05g0234721 [Helianthus annuus]
MYPLIWQITMNVQHPDLSKEDNDVLKIDVMKEISLKIFKGYGAKSYKESDPPRKLFGFLDNNTYIALENDKWRHDNNGSDNEEPTLNKMIEDKFGKKSESDDDDSDDEGSDGGEGGDGGNVGAGAASAHGSDDANSGSDDNPPEPGYEHYIDQRGIHQLRRIRTDRDQDEDYVPSDTEAADIQKKKQAAIQRKKKMKKTVGTSSSAHAFVQQETIVEPVQEAEVNPQFAFSAEEAAVMTASLSEAPQPPPTTTSATETPIVTPLVEPQQAGTSSSLRQQSEAHQRSSARRGRLF